MIRNSAFLYTFGITKKSLLQSSTIDEDDTSAVVMILHTWFVEHSLISETALPITIFIHGRLPENSIDLITAIILFLTNCSLVLRRPSVFGVCNCGLPSRGGLFNAYKTVISSFLIPEKCHSSRYLDEQNLKSNNRMKQKVHPPWSQCRPS